MSGWRFQRDSGHEPIQSSGHASGRAVTLVIPGDAGHKKDSTIPLRRTCIVFPVELRESSPHGIRIVKQPEMASRRIVRCPGNWRFPQDPCSDFFRRERSAPPARSTSPRTQV